MIDTKLHFSLLELHVAIYNVGSRALLYNLVLRLAETNSIF